MDERKADELYRQFHKVNEGAKRKQVRGCCKLLQVATLLPNNIFNQL